MSAEGEAIRSNDYRKDTTVKAPSTRPAAVLGLDVGKSSHWACLWQIRFLAARISEALDEAGALEAETAALLEGDETYACLLTVPGIGPRTAAQLAVSVDIGRFPDHDHLASYCGIAPRVRSSGTSVRSVRASRRGDARLKSLLIFSCNSLVRSSGRYGEYYRACRARGMGHGRALKAVARKRLRAIYAVMRDRVPYRE